MSGFLSEVSKDSKDALESISSTVDGKFRFMGGMDAKDEMGGSSKWCVLIRDPSEICGGLIGSAGKFCAVKRGQCKVSSHAQKRVPNLSPGLFVRAGIPKEELRVAPRIDLADVTGELCQEVLGKDFSSVQEVVQFFDQINSEEKDVKKQLKFDDLNEAHVEKKVRVNTKTPAKRTRENFIERYEQFHSSSLSGSTLTDEALEILEKVKVFNQFLATQLDDGQAVGIINSEKLDALKLEIGLWPSEAKGTTPLSLWVGLAELQDDMDALHHRHEEAVAQANKRWKASADESWKVAVQGVATALSSDIDTLRGNVRLAVEAVEQQVNSVKGNGWTEFQSVATLYEANEIASVHDVELQTIKDQVNRIQSQVQTLVESYLSLCG